MHFSVNEGRVGEGRVYFSPVFDVSGGFYNFKDKCNFFLSSFIDYFVTIIIIIIIIVIIILFIIVL